MLQPDKMDLFSPLVTLIIPFGTHTGICRIYCCSRLHFVWCNHGVRLITFSLFWLYHAILFWTIYYFSTHLRWLENYTFHHMDSHGAL